MSENHNSRGQRVAIVGSREYPDMEEVRRFVRLLPEGTVVVTGGAEGVDNEAITAAHEVFLSVEIHWPDWNTHGKAAGPLRNTTIVKDCDKLVAFWNGYSSGTSDVIEKARRAGKLDKVFIKRRAPKGARRKAREPDLAWWERADAPTFGATPQRRRRPVKEE